MDIGWLLGELLELRILEIIDQEKFIAFVFAFIDVYADNSHFQLDIDRIECFAVLRAILHCFDYFVTFGDLFLCYL
ncbi:hypothetical protein CFREI_07730 [Corynebacterium freiburgense]|nr:hypothetical protein CFREI_07730 [Corynebacterium freiburgense]